MEQYIYSDFHDVSWVYWTRDVSVKQDIAIMEYT